MNERIAKLIEECTDRHFSEGGGFETFDKEKFAQLIVRECATLCINEGRAHDQWFGSHCAITLKEHFRVDTPTE